MAVVKLPEIEDKLPQVREAQSKISAAQVAQPHLDLARNLDQAAGELNEASKLFAREAGFTAVTRDEQGNVKVERPPIIGDAAVYYQNSVKMAALTDGETVAKKDMLALRKENENDPEAFRVAAKSYRDEKVSQYRTAAGPQVGLRLGEVIDNISLETYRGLSNAKETRDTQRAEQSFRLQLETNSNELFALKMGGLADDAPEVRSRLLKQGAIYGQMIRNPKMGMSQERADFEISRLGAELEIAGIGSSIDKVLGGPDGVEKATAIAERVRTDPKLNLTPSQRVAAYTRLTSQINQRLTQQTQIASGALGEIKNIARLAEEGLAPSPEQAAAVRQSVIASNNPALMATLENLETVQPIIADWRKGSPSQVEQHLVDIARAEREHGPTPVTRMLTEVGGKLLDNMRKEIKDDPLGHANKTGAVYVPPLDFSRPDLPAQMRWRAATAETVAATYDGRSVEYLRPAERATFAEALMSPDPERAALAQAALNSAPANMQDQMLRGKEIKEAVAGAAMSPDPARYNSAMTFMDRAWSTRGPDATKAVFGEDSVHALMTWQARMRYMTPEALAEERKRRGDDPQVIERRKVNEAAGRDIARKEHKVDNIVEQFDTFFRLPGNAPQPPTDPLTRDTLMGDFENVFARRYAETLNKDTALTQTVEMLKTKWQMSPTNNNRLMLNAPEKVRGPDGSLIYPAINGAHDWMKPQIESDIAKQVGKPMREGPYEVMNWNYSLVADRQTQAETQNGRLASYQVVVTDAKTGRATVLPARFVFDPTEALAKSRERFETERKGRAEMFPGFTVP